MNRILLLLFAGICATTVHAQFANGYYRVQNEGTKRYISVQDGYGKVDATGKQADGSALRTILKQEEIVGDPGTIIYFQNTGTNSQYNLLCQGINHRDLIDYPLTIWDNGDGTYKARATKSGITLYLCDQYFDPDLAWALPEEEVNYGHVVTYEGAGNGSNWYITPLSNDNYFGVRPDFALGSDFYKSFCACFPFSFASSGMAAYTISAVDEGKGVAVIKEVSGTVPGGTPVIIKCASNEPTNNRLNITGYPVSGRKPIQSADNLLQGVYFCNSSEYTSNGTLNPHYDAIPYNASTMRVLGKTSKGELAFIKATNITHIPANSCYITVSASAPDELLVVDKIPEDPEVRGDLNGDGKVNITDIISILNLIKNGEYRQEADLNNDGKVNITDIIAILNIIKG